MQLKRIVGFPGSSPWAVMVAREEDAKMWQRLMIEAGRWYVLTAGESSDEVFEEVVRKEDVLRRVYTVFGSL